MSDKTIRKGDLVMIKDGPVANHRRYAGHYVTAKKLHQEFCGKCWAVEPASLDNLGREIVWPERYLRKIDPPATGEYDGVSVRKPISKPIKQREPA